MKTTFLYTLSDPGTGKIRYLGKSDEPFKRYREHLQDKTDTYKSRWVKGLKKLGLKPTMELLDEVLESQWEFWEREYIRIFRAIGMDLVNTTGGGDGTSGYQFTPTDRAKMSASHTGVPMSPEHIAARTASQAGKKRVPKTQESKAKQSKSMKARWADPALSLVMRSGQKSRRKLKQISLFRMPRNPASPETRAKMSAAHTGVKLSPEHLVARSEGQKGKGRSEQAKENMKAGQALRRAKERGEN